MAQSTISSLDEANAPQVTAEHDVKTSRPKSPLSGGSDNDGAEKPVRERLKKASIAGLSTHGKTTDNYVRPDSIGAESSAGEEEKDREDSMLTDTTPSSRGRPTRKRSFDDLQNESATSVDAYAQEHVAQPTAYHKRMRSRDMSSTKTTAMNGRAEKEQVEALAEEEDDVEAQKSPGGAGIMVGEPSTDIHDATSGSQSPKKKRSRDQFDKDQSAESGALKEEGKDAAPPEKEQYQLHDEISRTNSISDKGEPDKKRHRDTSQEDGKVAGTEPAGRVVEQSSGFANTAAVSPFGSLASSKSSSTVKRTPEPEPTTQGKKQTSSSAFASSGLSAFASSSKSPFGNLGGSSSPSSGSGSGFGSIGPKPSSGFSSSSGFRGASPFAAQAASGIGSLGGTGFGSTLGSGFAGPKTGPSSFLPPGGSTGIIGSGSLSKPLGKSEDNDQNGDENDDAASSKAEDDADAKDTRFFEQQVETGEEAEETMFSCRAKLFHFDKEWKERGVGTVKLNVHYDVNEDPEEAAEQRARLIMRTDGVHRVVLNAPIFKGMRYGTPDGKEPTGKTLNLTGMEDGKPALFLLKIGKEDMVKELYHRISCIHDGL